MAIRVRVNGNTYINIKDASVSRSLDSNSGSFRFTTSRRADFTFPVKKGDLVEMTVNGEPKCKGYIDRIEISGDSGSDNITVSGRDVVQDILDSTVPKKTQVVEGVITLFDLCVNVISALGADIGVISPDLDPFLEGELTSAEVGQTCMDFLMQYARKRQVFLNSDGQGNLVIYRAEPTASRLPIIHRFPHNGGAENNIKDFSFTDSDEDRFFAYTCKSQDDYMLGAGDYSEAGTDRSGTALDDEIRESRIFEFVAEQEMTDQECADRATEEANIRRSRGVSYRVAVVGEDYDINQLVRVVDDYCGIYANLLINEITYNYSESGTVSQLNMTYPDAYTLQASLDAKSARSTTIGDFADDE